MIINGENLILGRMAAYVAKKILEGENVEIVNCEKVVIIGKKDNILAKYRQRVNRGTPKKGPFFPKIPDRLVRRSVRGMLPWDKPRGREAFKRVMCHVGVPDKFKNEKIETFDNINVLNTKNVSYTTIKEICNFLK